MDPPGEPQNPNINYNLLLQQIQTLSELQNNGGIQNADPSIQVGCLFCMGQKKKTLETINRAWASASWGPLTGTWDKIVLADLNNFEQLETIFEKLEWHFEKLEKLKNR